MGIVAFYWAEEGDNQLTVAMSRDNWDNRDVSRASWHGDIMYGRCRESAGTWFGISRRGRVALLVDTRLSENRVGGHEHDEGPELYPIEFLEDTVCPRLFADYVSLCESGKPSTEDSRRASFSLIFADPAWNSMIHFRKHGQTHFREQHITIEPVNYGVHTLSPWEGLDCAVTQRDLRVRSLFSWMIDVYGIHHIPPLAIVVDWFFQYAEEKEEDVFFTIYDEPRFGEEKYRITSTTLATVSRTGGINFLEKCTYENPSVMVLMETQWAASDFVYVTDDED